MKTLTLTHENKASVLAELLVVLASGGTIVYPTETSYALGANFFSTRACRAVYTLKGRSRNKPLPVLIPGRDYARTLVQFSPRSEELSQKYWPGPLTLVLPFLYSEEWPHHTDKFLAVRLSSHPIASALAHAFGRPIVATSANRSGRELCYTISDVLQQYEHVRSKPDLVLDAGKLPRRIPSTIIKDDLHTLKVLRPGLIKLN